ncbi:DUF397 domain-containing protein [Nocardia sp. ET3-3]|uniref:DUF397 domain-containing protein n=1 Tax=Nocardia terrae TaxID=2675851 RepID=A0A7K1UQZ4_9NOCA|nr:DUF397 domain-containing protein [Nocardia terrae]MVU76754.1 DUF397 domain-containing protein [Nocardia terrae]
MRKPIISEWYKSSFSDAGKECIEVRHDPAVTLVRDTKDRGRGPILSFPAEAWTAFLASDVWRR